MKRGGLRKGPPPDEPLENPGSFPSNPEIEPTGNPSEQAIRRVGIGRVTTRGTRSPEERVGTVIAVRAASADSFLRNDIHISAGNIATTFFLILYHTIPAHIIFG